MYYLYILRYTRGYHYFSSNLNTLCSSLRNNGSVAPVKIGVRCLGPSGAFSLSFRFWLTRDFVVATRPTSQTNDDFTLAFVAMLKVLSAYGFRNIFPKPIGFVQARALSRTPLIAVTVVAVAVGWYWY